MHSVAGRITATCFITWKRACFGKSWWRPTPDRRREVEIMHAHLCITAFAIGLLTALTARSESESQHVAPGPPANSMPDMSYREMAQMMEMDDAARIGMVQFDRFEWRDVAGA